MVTDSPRLERVLPKTLGDTDIREEPRAACPMRPALRIMIRPSFLPITVVVQDISSKGIGLLCDSHLALDACLAILWMYGPPNEWRTVQARVVRLSPRRDGGWVAGCVFAERLRPGEMESFLRFQHEPMPVRRRYDD
jgi:PilZ domain